MQKIKTDWATFVFEDISSAANLPVGMAYFDNGRDPRPIPFPKTIFPERIGFWGATLLADGTLRVVFASEKIGQRDFWIIFDPSKWTYGDSHEAR